MRVYTVEGVEFYLGAQTEDLDHNRRILLGGGSNSKTVSFFKKNPPDIRRSGYFIEAYPVKIRDGYALAKPNHGSNEILIVVRTRATHEDNRPRNTGHWYFTQRINSYSSFPDKVLVKATGPREYFAVQDIMNVGWCDALLVMGVGDILEVIDQNGKTIRVKYESVEGGLVGLIE